MTATREEIEAAMLSGEPFTYRQMVVRFTTDNDQSRIVDRCIQRLRKSNAIAWDRQNGRITWRAIR